MKILLKAKAVIFLNSQRLLLMICFLHFTTAIFAQESTKQKEVGIVFQDLDNFGLNFKTGTSSAMWRFTTLTADYASFDNDSPSNKQDNKQFALTVKVGREYRKEIAENFEIRYGLDLFYSHSNYYDEDIEIESVISYRRYKRKMNGGGLQLVSGFNYVINNKLVFGAEILPGVGYQKLIEEEIDPNYLNETTETDRFYFGLGNNAANLSISYRF